MKGPMRRDLNAYLSWIMGTQRRMFSEHCPLFVLLTLVTILGQTPFWRGQEMILVRVTGRFWACVSVCEARASCSWS